MMFYVTTRLGGQAHGGRAGKLEATTYEEKWRSRFLRSFARANEVGMTTVRKNAVKG